MKFAFAFLLCSTSVLVLGYELFPENPGIVGTLTQRGLDTVQDVILKNITSGFQNFEIPGEISGSASFASLKYKFTKNKVSSFSLGTVTNKIQAPSSIHTSIKGAYFNIVGNWEISYKILWRKINDHGTFTANIAKSDLNLVTEVGVRKDGLPTIMEKMCSASIGDLKIKVDQGGFANSVYNFALRFANKRLKKTLQNLVCPTIQDLFMDQADSITLLYPKNVPLIFDTSVETALVRNISVVSMTTSLSFSGRCFPNNNPNIRFPVPSPEIPAGALSDKMIQLQASEYVLNTFLHAISYNNLLNFVVTDDTLPDDSYVRLTTEFFGSILSAFQGFPRSPIEAKIVPLNPIAAQFREGLIFIAVDLNVTMCVVREDGARFNALSLIVNVTTTGFISVTDQVIQGGLNKIVVTTSLGESNVGVVPVPLIDLVIQGLTRDTVKPIIDDLLSTGVKIPSILGFSAQNTLLNIEEKILKIETDLAFMQM